MCSIWHGSFPFCWCWTGKLINFLEKVELEKEFPNFKKGGRNCCTCLPHTMLPWDFHETTICFFLVCFVVLDKNSCWILSKSALSCFIARIRKRYLWLLLWICLKGAKFGSSFGWGEWITWERFTLDDWG